MRWATVIDCIQSIFRENLIWSLRAAGRLYSSTVVFGINTQEANASTLESPNLTPAIGTRSSIEMLNEMQLTSQVSKLSVGKSW